MTSVHVSFVALLLVIVQFASIGAQDIDEIPDPDPNYLQMFILPVGQGDCTVMQCPVNGNIIIFDCGSSGAGNGNRLSALQVQQWLRVADIDRNYYILISHPDQDHYNYLPAIFPVGGGAFANINGVIIGGCLEDYYRNGDPWGIYDWLTHLNGQGRLSTISSNTNPVPRCIGDCKLDVNNIVMPLDFCDNQNYTFYILAANVRYTSNEKSIVMKVVGRNDVQGIWSMLLSGDMEGGASQDIVNYFMGTAVLQSTIYQMSHHGASNLANSNAWLQAIAPSFAFASSGYDYGICVHPRCVAINRLTNVNSLLYATPHNIYCGNQNRNPVPILNFERSLYETSPNQNEICLISYTDAFIPHVTCDIPPNVQSELLNNETVYDLQQDECDDDPGDNEAADGVLSKVAN